MAFSVALVSVYYELLGYNSQLHHSLASLSAIARKCTWHGSWSLVLIGYIGTIAHAIFVLSSVDVAPRLKYARDLALLLAISISLLALQLL